MSEDQESKTPEQIRAEIAEVRDDLGDTVEALGAKSDVKGRAQSKVQDIKDNIKSEASGAGTKVKDATPENVHQGAQAVADKIKANPLPVAISAALALGILIGRRAAR